MATKNPLGCKLDCGDRLWSDFTKRHFIVFLKCKLKLSTLTGQVIWVFMLFCLTHQGRVFQTKFSMSGSSLQCPVGTSGAALEQGKREHTLPLRLQQ